MADSTLAKKLGIKPGYRLLILNAPEGYTGLLGPMLEGVSMVSRAEAATTYDWVQVFCQSRADVEKHAQEAIGAVRQGGLLWLCYPKKTSGIKTDIHRDVGWESMWAAGWEGIALISIDDTWSSMRFRPSSEVRSGRRNKAEGESH